MVENQKRDRWLDRQLQIRRWTVLHKSHNTLQLHPTSSGSTITKHVTQAVWNLEPKDTNNTVIW